MKENKDITKKSKELAYLLRHNPKSLVIEQDGWTNVDLLLEEMGIEKDFLETIVKEDSKGRYSFNEDRSKIRANQGHSIDVKINFKKAMPPTKLYHGTKLMLYATIRKNGILKMNRQYVHLSADMETAREVGRRHAKKEKDVVVFEIDTKKMVKDKIDFYISENGVWLTDTVHPRYIK